MEGLGGCLAWEGEVRQEWGTFWELEEGALIAVLTLLVKGSGRGICLGVAMGPVKEAFQGPQYPEVSSRNLQKRMTKSSYSVVGF